MVRMSPQTPAPVSAPACFRFKGSSIALTELELLDYRPEQLQQQLEAQSRAMPQLFQQMPILLNLVKLPEEQALPELDALVALCRTFGINPIGVRGDARLDPACCQAAGIAYFSAGRSSIRNNDVPSSVAVSANGPQAETSPVEPQENSNAQPAATTDADKPEENGAATARIITTPVRSGQQIYARGGDLIILAAVGAGAEVMADGNIHIYGALRGRAMAGVCGNEQARIFCQSLEAELISIAGFFKACDDLQSEQWKQPAQAFLNGTRLETAAL